MDYYDYGNGVRNDLDYDGRGFTKLTNSFRLSPSQPYTRRDYWRDSRDRITAWKKTETGRGERYSYDAEGQLTNASYQALTPEATPTGALRSDIFTYDALGNRQGWNYLANRGWMNFTRRDNGLNQYWSWENNIPATGPGHWGSAIYHDENAPWAPWNVLPGNGVTMADGWLVASYNALNQPVAMIPYGSANVFYFGYDPLGRCVKRWEGSSGMAGSNPATYFYYDGWSLVQEGSSAANVGRLYVHGNRVDEIVASQKDGVWNYHHYDARGHCILLTGPSGNVIEQYEYDAFGKPYFYNAFGVALPYGSSYGNRFLFTGREWLSGLKLYDYRARMYQPELGRFLQPDPKQFEAGDYNLYRYCHNDPVNKSDPFGLEDRVIITFEPAMGNMKPVWSTQAQIDVHAPGAAAVTIVPAQGGITTTATVNPTTKDVTVNQRVQAVTLLPKKEEALGTKSALAKEEMSRIQGYRNATTNAGVAGNDLAEKGFKGNAEAAKSAVEASTRQIIKDKTDEMRRMYDVNHAWKK